MGYSYFCYAGNTYFARCWIDRAGGHWIDLLAWTTPPRGADQIGASGDVCNDWLNDGRSPWSELFLLTLGEL